MWVCVIAQQIVGQWRKICDKAGLSGLKFHDLQNTFASILAQNGVSTAVTQRLLEHSSPNLTNKIYTNVDPVLRNGECQESFALFIVVLCKN
ncbi:MAG: tyrosine-type recombinase/integrase [Pirellulales bacterium]|nr:tyrosine-type recombinase/integrase [Pirellulales bacterium]